MCLYLKCYLFVKMKIHELFWNWGNPCWFSGNGNLEGSRKQFYNPPGKCKYFQPATIIFRPGCFSLGASFLIQSTQVAFRNNTVALMNVPHFLKFASCFLSLWLIFFFLNILSVAVKIFLTPSSVKDISSCSSEGWPGESQQSYI